jgi:hypothetical protein
VNYQRIADVVAAEVQSARTYATYSEAARQNAEAEIRRRGGMGPVAPPWMSARASATTGPSSTRSAESWSDLVRSALHDED